MKNPPIVGYDKSMAFITGKFQT